MLLTTQSGILVQFRHVTYIALRREETSPSLPLPEELKHKVLLFLGSGGQEISVVAARHLSLAQARFVREDIANAWETDQKRWRAEQSLRRFAEGAYFSTDGETPESESEKEVDHER